MKRILLIGRSGQLGWELNRSLATLGELTALDYPEIDFQNVTSIRDCVRELHPTIIVNAAAYTDVDKAESERDKTRQINAFAPAVLAEEARKLDALLVHYSTDYVFDGKKGSPYVEEDKPNPLNYYGESKLEGENLVRYSGCEFLIFRTSWVYSLKQKGGFVNKVLQWSRQNEVLRIVEDQVSNPTWARLMAEITAQVLSGNEGFLRSHTGLYHLAGSGYASRLEWARLILELDPRGSEQVTRQILPALSAEFPTPATRPLFSVLACERFTSVYKLFLPEWRQALRLAMED
jgi:dTDP-4-dehydrorhamnose reductase